MMHLDMAESLLSLLGGFFALLALCVALLGVVKRSKSADENQIKLDFLRERVKAWGLFFLFLCGAVWCGVWGVGLFFAVISFQCFREYISMTKTKISDHHALIWSFYFFLPAHYVFLSLHWGTLFGVFIPVGAFLFLPMTAVLRKDTKQFLTRMAQIQWGLMICVYFLSYIPALVFLNPMDEAGKSLALIVFFLLLVFSANIFECIWNGLMPHCKVFPACLPEPKTVEGVIAGLVGALVIGSMFYGFTALSFKQVLFIVPATVLAGCVGRMVLAAIKQDKGMENWSYRHGSMSRSGMLDLMDSFCFAAPVFFYTCYFLRGV
ncbi:MAG: phosphatidate cytidylyltransferase [Saezia sp.]